jgi:hypothetical protein
MPDGNEFLVLMSTGPTMSVVLVLLASVMLLLILLLPIIAMAVRSGKSKCSRCDQRHSKSVLIQGNRGTWLCQDCLLELGERIRHLRRTQTPELAAASDDGNPYRSPSTQVACALCNSGRLAGINIQGAVVCQDCVQNG